VKNINYNAIQFNSLKEINNEVDENMRSLRLYKHFGDDKFKNELLVKNLPLVYARAKRYYLIGKIDDAAVYYDFVQEGVIGFLKGIEKYDRKLAKGAKISSYCVYWIDKYIANYIIENVSTIRYTHRVHRAFSKFKKMKMHNDFEGMNAPIDYFIDGGRAERLGVIDLANGKDYMDVNDVEIHEIDYVEGDAEDLIMKCEYLNDDDKSFAITTICKKSENGLTIAEKRKLKSVTEKITLWNKRLIKKGLKITDVMDDFNKLVELKVPATDEVIEDFAEKVYYIEKPKGHVNDIESAAEMRGIIRGMKIMRDAINNSKNKK
jgi:hypothetical protein